jgi:hypothetical protein
MVKVRFFHPESDDTWVKEFPSMKAFDEYLDKNKHITAWCDWKVIEGGQDDSDNYKA